MKSHALDPAMLSSVAISLTVLVALGVPAGVGECFEPKEPCDETLRSKVDHADDCLWCIWWAASGEEIHVSGSGRV